jgi:hypothetical protein
MCWRAASTSRRYRWSGFARASARVPARHGPAAAARARRPHDQRQRTAGRGHPAGPGARQPAADRAGATVPDHDHPGRREFRPDGGAPGPAPPRHRPRHGSSRAAATASIPCRQRADNSKKRRARGHSGSLSTRVPALRARSSHFMSHLSRSCGDVRALCHPGSRSGPQMGFPCSRRVVITARTCAGAGRKDACGRAGIRPSGPALVIHANAYNRTEA